MPKLDELDVALIIDMLPEELERPNQKKQMNKKEFLEQCVTLQDRPKDEARQA